MVDWLNGLFPVFCYCRYYCKDQLLSLSLRTHVGAPDVAVFGCCGAAQELWQEAGGVGLVGISAAGWKAGPCGDGTFPPLPCVFLWPVSLQGPPVSPQLRGQTYVGTPPNMAPETDVAQGKKRKSEKEKLNCLLDFLLYVLLI